MKSLKKLIRPLSRITLLFCVGAMPSVAMSSGDYRIPPPGPALSEILVHARKTVGEFWGHFASVTCTEKVAQEKLGKQGKVEYTRKSTYDYLVLSNSDKDDLSVEESRLEQGGSKKEKNLPLLVASGLPMLLLVFHPSYEADFRYQLEGDELVDGRKCVKVRFQHIPGARSTTALRLRGRDYPLDIQGTAYIDPETGAIHRIAAGIAEPMTDFNLKALEMDVRYDPHPFESAKSIFWLPSKATVSIQTERQQWRNTHQYSNYKRFTVNAEDRVSK